MKTIKITGYKDTNPYNSLDIYNLSIIEDFLTICPNVKECSINELNELNLSKYLHSLEGPAIQRLNDGAHKYYINGKSYGDNRDAWERAVHDYKFKNKLEKLIED